MAEITNDKAQVDVTSDSCSIGDLTCAAKEKMGTYSEAGLDMLSTMVLEAVEGVIRALFTGAMEMPMALIAHEGSVVSFLQNNLGIVAQTLTMFAIILFAGKLIFKPNADTVSHFGGYMFKVVVVSGGSIYIGTQLILTADGYSDWILDKAMAGTDLAEFVIDMLMVTGAGGAFIMIIMGIGGLLVTAGQILFMLARNMVILPILLGAAPVVVAGSFTQIGKQWWSTYIGWFAGWLLFKPVLATIYAGGFYVFKNGNPFGNVAWTQDVVDILTLLSGVMIITFAMFGGYAVLKAAVPGAAMVTGKLESTGRMAAATTASALAATGAVGRATGGVSTAAPASVTPLNAAAKAADAPTGSQGTPSQSGPSGNRPGSGWDTNVGSAGTPQGASRGPQGPTGASGMPSTAPAASKAPTGAVGTPNSKPSADARNTI